MLILPMLNRLYPGMKFIHVVRDGRDISLGNKFAERNRHRKAFLADHEKELSSEEEMILFWGRSNQRAMDYARESMPGRYLRMKWEDLCTDPVTKTAELLEFASRRTADAEEIARIVRKPGSMGRWKSFPAMIQRKVHSRGAPWLTLFGYA
jgi:Sulfotransferase family